MQWYLIANPVSGKRLRQNAINRLVQQFEKEGWHLKVFLSSHKGHEQQLIEEILEIGGRKILVAGGDGTLHQAVNGVMKQHLVPVHEITLGLIAIGSGNDWRRTHGLKDGWQHAIPLIKKGRIMQHDVGKVLIDEQQTVYFINMAGVGFDAQTVLKVSEKRHHAKQSAMGYLRAMLSCLGKYNHFSALITFDALRKEGNFFTAMVAIAQYAGNGMHLAPDALPYDGYFHTTLVKPISKLKVMLNIRSLFTGRFFHLKEVSVMRSKLVELIATHEYLQADGELYQGSSFRFECLPAAIQILVP